MLTARYGLGWNEPLPDDRDYPVSRYSASDWKLQPVLWTVTAFLNQQKTNHCVGFGGANFLNTLPVNDGYTDGDAHDLYYACKVVDKEPLAENGSTVHSLAKELRARGRIVTYAWSLSLNEILLWLSNQGPVVVGTYWTTDMFEPKEGIIHPTGNVEGGHCYCMVGYDPVTTLITFLNSWGKDWGLGGLFKMYAEEWRGLAQRGMEAMMAVELPVGQVPPPPEGCLPLLLSLLGGPK